MPVKRSSDIHALPELVSMVVNPRITPDLRALEAWELMGSLLIHRNFDVASGEWSCDEWVGEELYRVKVEAYGYGPSVLLKLGLQGPTDSSMMVTALLVNVTPSGTPLQWTPVRPAVIVWEPPVV